MPITRLALRLPLTPPLDAAALLDHFARRAVPGIERITAGTYERSLALPHGAGVVALRLGEVAGEPLPGGPADGPALRGGPADGPALPGGPADGPALRGELVLADGRDRGHAESLCRALLDLDHDPGTVRTRLGGDGLLGPAVAASPGRRVPGAADPAELCVRAILGQQISLAGAATAAGRLVERFGRPLGALARDGITHIFPEAATLAAADPETLAMPRARARSLVGLAAALTGGELALRRGGDPVAARTQLLALPGIGPWTADYVVMRVLGDHDVFLATDLGVRRALERAGLPADPRSAAALADRWRPLRSYALQYLWTL